MRRVAGGLVGSFATVVRRRLGADLVVASSVFVTLVTDPCGFRLLLDLASWRLP